MTRDIEFDATMVMEDLFSGRHKRLSESPNRFLHIYWDGGESPHDAGFWVIRPNDTGLTHFDDWEERIFLVGEYPYVSHERYFSSPRLRCVVLGVRRRVILDDICQDYFKGNACPRNFLTAHTQVMIALEYLEQPAVIDLRGLVRSSFWSSDYDGGSLPDMLFFGVEQQIKDFGQFCSDELSEKIPWQCSWRHDLVSMQRDYEPHFVKIVERESVTEFNPFTVDLPAEWSEEVSSRFVGMDEFIRLQTIRKYFAIPWEDEWTCEGSMSQVLSPTMDAQWEEFQIQCFLEDSRPGLPVDDEIPF